MQNPQWGKSRQSRHCDDFDEINGRHTTYYKRCVSTCPICIRAAYLLGPPLVLSLRLPAQPAWNWCHQWHIYTLSIYIYTVVDSSLSISQPITTKNWHDSLLCCLNLTKKLSHLCWVLYQKFAIDLFRFDKLLVSKVLGIVKNSPILLKFYMKTIGYITNIENMTNRCIFFIFTNSKVPQES